MSSSLFLAGEVKIVCVVSDGDSRLFSFCLSFLGSYLFCFFFSSFLVFSFSVLFCCSSRFLILNSQYLFGLSFLFWLFVLCVAFWCVASSLSYRVKGGHFGHKFLFGCPLLFVSSLLIRLYIYLSLRLSILFSLLPLSCYVCYLSLILAPSPFPLLCCLSLFVSLLPLSFSRLRGRLPPVSVCYLSHSLSCLSLFQSSPAQLRFSRHRFSPSPLCYACYLSLILSLLCWLPVC